MLTAAPLCKCICGNQKKGDPVDYQLDSFNQVEEVAPTQPPCAGVLSFYDGSDQPMRGVPIREGNLCILSAEEEVEPITLSLYVSGVSFVHRGRTVSLSFSPFSLVRSCKFQLNAIGDRPLSSFRCFKVSLFTQGVCCYFGIPGDDDHSLDEERTKWVLDVARAIRLVTQSLFPMHIIRSEPVSGALRTHRRLMAGYLIHQDGGTVVSVLYCELHPHNSLGAAKLVIYENESCLELLNEVLITERTDCMEKVGINCSCFSICEHHFSARTLNERRMWLRAVSNLKVKIANRAPSPTPEELSHYRTAIQEHVKADTVAQSHVPTDAMLMRLQEGKYSRNLEDFPPALDTPSTGYVVESVKACQNRNGAGQDVEDWTIPSNVASMDYTRRVGS